jgi:hypothetical protein
MKPSEKIINNLKINSSFCLKQIFGYPFVDFRISHVGETFEELIDDDSAEILPHFEKVYGTFVSKWGDQFSDQSVSESAIKGRVARMWASLIREWYAYYRIKEILEKENLNATVKRNDNLDTFKGVDVYIENNKDKNKSIKIDILQETRRAKIFRDIKDERRVKDADVPGIKERVFLGSNNKNTLKIGDINGDEWYLIEDSEISRILNKFKMLNSSV